ncbi:hypothetical protein [Nocardia transvalensis]|uniref:hypothetical protein n=1 Tax=Nocardia transvalensis TaxID=37333 RepID=UPI0018955B20|nr:hypothetical protein [Nocardia transvalensis]MBF6333506.1 hypothetical protein [Nocardia transvalensis]
MEFKPIPPDLYRTVEPAAGTIWPVTRYRRHEVFEPNWPYLLSGKASAAAVVAGLCCGDVDVPERTREAIMRIYCPRAWHLLTEAHVTYPEWAIGRSSIELGSAVAALANIELGGYAVHPVMDIAALTAEIIGGLGGIPTFE